MNDLDADELFYLAMKASDEGDREKTISLLKRSIALEPQANAMYILGAEYAELGMTQRAIDFIEKALLVDPSLETARFQLGLLYMTTGLEQEARAAFDKLVALDENAYLHQFSAGMVHLIDENVSAGIECLSKGIELNDENGALNRDMANVIAELKAHVDDLLSDDFYSEAVGALEEPSANSTNVTPNPSTADRTHLLISKYGQGKVKG